jgi:1-deoxy-D-xylulose-5-phosphate reductoisomerase
MITDAMDNHHKIENPTVEQILETESWTYSFLGDRY